LGSQANSEARIDLIAQAWAVLFKVSPAKIAKTIVTTSSQVDACTLQIQRLKYQRLVDGITQR
jgi:hypothetical protein